MVDPIERLAAPPFLQDEPRVDRPRPAPRQSGWGATEARADVADTQALFTRLHGQAKAGPSGAKAGSGEHAGVGVYRDHLSKMTISPVV
jgi:hypothetical protein